MKDRKKILFSSAIALGALAVVGVPSVMAAETIGTVTGKDGDTKELLSINAEVVETDGSHVLLKDSETSEVYETSFGPSWYSDEYEAGDTVEVIAVETDAENNDEGHNLQVLELDGTTLREEFESRPEWAGGKGSRNEAGSRHQASGNGGSNFIDADGDGNCDNL